jgi:hypothetical protein
MSLAATSKVTPRQNTSMASTSPVSETKETTRKMNLTTTKARTSPSHNHSSTTHGSKKHIFDDENLIEFFSVAPSSPCKPKRKPATRLVIGECSSQQEIQQESCAGYCPSYEELDPFTGDISAKECSCCAPDILF